jgi:DNA-binding MarR family transcriptional regulator
LVTRKSKSELADEVLTAVRAYVDEASNLEQIVADLSGVGRTEVRCLGLLDRSGGQLTAGRLAELSRLTTGAITGVVDRLERAGLARRIPDPTDRRKVIIELDEVAHARGDEAYGPLVEAQRVDLQRLSVDQLEAVRHFLVRGAEQTSKRASELEAPPHRRRVRPTS